MKLNFGNIYADIKDDLTAHPDGHPSLKATNQRVPYMQYLNLIA